MRVPEASFVRLIDLIDIDRQVETLREDLEVTSLMGLIVL